MAHTAIAFLIPSLLAFLSAPAAASSQEATLLDGPFGSEVGEQLDSGDAPAASNDRADRRGAAVKGRGGASGSRPAAKAAPAARKSSAAPARSTAAPARSTAAPAAKKSTAAPARSTPAPAAKKSTAAPARSTPAPAAQRSTAAPAAQKRTISRASQAREGQGSQGTRPGNGQGQGGDRNGQNQGGDRNGQNQGGARDGQGQHQRPDQAQSPRAGNSHVRPSSSGGRPPAHASNGGKPRPPRHVVHQRAGLPSRWAPSYHRYHLRGVPHHSPRYWATGIFIYNPPPARHRVVVKDSSGQRIKNAEPTRAVDRNRSLALGVRGGTYASGYEKAGGYGDMGLGLALRYRPVESVGLELSWMHHSDSFDEHSQRDQDPVSASVQLFAFPWTRVSPYALVGLTVTPRSVEDSLGAYEYQGFDALAGPHAGLGLEFAVGEKASLNFEGRYISYIDRQEDDIALPGAVQGTMGLNFYF